MTREDFIKLLSDIEEKLPVSKWKYGDMQIWPIIKKDIFFKWLSSGGNISEKSNKTVSAMRKISAIADSLKYYLKLRLKKNTVVDIAFVGAAAHRVDYDSKFINRYFYPLIKEQQNLNFIQFEYGIKNDSKEYNNVLNTIFVKKLLPAFQLLNAFNKQILYVPEWEQFVSQVEQHTQLSLKINKHLHSVYSIAQAYSFLFKKYKPNKVLSLCYYKNDTLAMHFAANKLGIENIDMQHGAQGPLHVMYNFSKPPLEGYNTVPKTFWCWDEASAITIRKWLVKQNYHSLIVGGNPWIKFQLANVKEEKLSNKKIILFTLQEEFLDPYILDTIGMTRQNYEWWLRLHPRMLSGKENIQKQLLEKGLTNYVEIDRATTLPLPLLLKNSSVHLSKYSGSIIEAIQVNTPNIIIDQIGVETYSEYVQNGDVKVVVSKNANELIQVIQSLA